jgi:hypothetical protein
MKISDELSQFNKGPIPLRSALLWLSPALHFERKDQGLVTTKKTDSFFTLDVSLDH